MELTADCSQFARAVSEITDQVAASFPLLTIGRSQGTECPACWLPLCFHDTVMLSTCRRRISFG